MSDDKPVLIQNEYISEKEDKETQLIADIMTALEGTDEEPDEVLKILIDTLDNENY